jgi:flagellin-like hook-associated protein FlgL
MLWSPTAYPAGLVEQVHAHLAPEESLEVVLDVARNAANKIAVTFGGATSTALSVSNISVSGTDASNSLASITAIDAAIQNLSTTRENFGAAINRFTTTV